jgi:hypothetical protein
MTLAAEKTDIEALVGLILDGLGATISSHVGVQGAVLRRQIGDLRADWLTLLQAGDNSFSVALLGCFTTARTSGGLLAGFTNLRLDLFAETNHGPIATLIVDVTIIFCLAAEGRIVGAMQFVSRDDVEAMIIKMRAAYEQAKLIIADTIDPQAYQDFLAMGAALIQHLSATARPLPRMIQFTVATPLPALTLSNLIYRTATRSDEIIDENKIVHPAFCPLAIMGLSQ